MLKPLSPMVLALILAPVALSAQQIESWDVDGDGMIAGAEFVGGLTQLGAFERLDASADGAMDASEWAPLEQVMPFTQADLNADGVVDQSEHAGILFARYDVDGSGALDPNEMATTAADMAPGGLLGG